MEQTRCAFKVVSDPYAPEERWLPACNEVDSSTALVAKQPIQFPSQYHRVALTALLAMLAGAFGGALLGQAAHVTYYLHHLSAALLYNDMNYEQWGHFYYWFNQVSATYAFIPVMFSYAVGFLGVPFGLGRKSIWLGLLSAAAYYIVINFIYPGQGNAEFTQPQLYVFIWNAIGVVGSFLAFTLGRKVAGSLSLIVHPEKLFGAMLVGLVPGSILFVPGFLLDRFELLVCLCFLVPLVIGMLAPYMLRASSLKSSLCLALTANSPIVLCALLHIPIGIWYVNSWSPRDVYGVMAEINQYFFYCLVPLMVPIAAALIGGLQGSKASIALRRKELLASLGDGTFAEDPVVALASTSPELS